ncbi:MAG: molybdopterin cofactor-binding domain-containing protein, partial [Gaiellaceae bacterium]
MARLIKTEKEVEGRFTEQWIVVEEDVLDPWQAGPLETVGRPAERVDARARARGEVQFTADVQLPGMLHAAVLRSPHARARLVAINLDAARSLPGVRGVIGPGDLELLTAEPNYHGQPVAAVAADSFREARDALAALAPQWERLEPLLDPEEAVRRGSLIGEARRYARGDVSQGLAQADVVVEAEYRTQSVLHNALETHQSVCVWEDARLTVYTSTQFIWGVRDDVAKAFSLPRDDVRVVCRYVGGGFGAKNEAGDYTLIAAELARTTGLPVRCALTRREENLDSGNRNPTIQRLAVGARADGTLTALKGEYVCALGWDGWLPSVAGPMKMLYACDSVETTEYGAKLNTAPMAAFRAPGFVEGVFGLECLLDELAV